MIWDVNGKFGLPPCTMLLSVIHNFFLHVFSVFAIVLAIIPNFYFCAIRRQTTLLNWLVMRDA